VVAFVFVRKLALPGVGAMPAVRRELIAPRKLGAVETAARGVLPFRFGRQILAGPLGVSERVCVTDVDDRMVAQRVDVTFRSVRMPPVGALEKRPPRAPVFQ